MSDFFSEQFQGGVKQGSSAFTGAPRPLKYPITPSEVEHAMNRRNNNRASGIDELPGELLKHGSHFQQILSQIGHGMLILLSGKQFKLER